jgi:hypothetical protein
LTEILPLRGASVRIGLAIAVLRPLAVRLSCYLARRSLLRVERTKAVPLGPEN